jgi:hypothetical protein
MGKQAGGSASPQSGSSQGTAGSAGTADGGRAQTPEERRGAIDKRLDDTLGTFDGEIRKEQEKNAQERDARNAATAGAGTAEDAESDEASTEESRREGDLASGSAGNEGPDGGKDKSSRPGDLKSDGQRKAESGNASGGGATGSGGAATEIPDGSDDDVVARRLRKAAEQETDPELKEKLWKEYVEYKKNAK